MCVAQNAANGCSFVRYIRAVLARTGHKGSQMQIAHLLHLSNLGTCNYAGHAFAHEDAR